MVLSAALVTKTGWEACGRCREMTLVQVLARDLLIRYGMLTVLIMLLIKMVSNVH